MILLTKNAFFQSLHRVIMSYLLSMRFHLPSHQLHQFLKSTIFHQNNFVMETIDQLTVVPIACAHIKLIFPTMQLLKLFLLMKVCSYTLRTEFLEKFSAIFSSRHFFYLYQHFLKFALFFQFFYGELEEIILKYLILGISIVH